VSYSTEYYAKNREVERKRARDASIKVPRRFSLGKQDAKQRRLLWTLTFEQYEALLQFGCHYCQKSLKDEKGISLDRIDNLEGYTLSNILPCCGECNRIRSNKYTVKETERIGSILKAIRYNKSMKGIK